MSTSVWNERADLSPFAGIALKFAVQFWFVVAVLGQWFFVLYVVAFYGGAALQGNLDAWNKVIPNGHTPGATMSNTAVAVHLILAVVIMVGGPLQLIPQMRRHFPRFHRWNGRLYIPSVVLTSIVGLYMIWSRGHDGRLVPHLGVSLDAVLIIIFSALTLHYVLAGRVSTHRRWALRLFMVVNAGWFFRIGLMQWVFLNRGPVGFDPETFTGPFLNALSFADYLLPLAVLEIYLRTKDSAGAAGRLAMAGGLVVVTVMMGIGIGMTAMVMWIPRM